MNRHMWKLIPALLLLLWGTRIAIAQGEATTPAGTPGEPARLTPNGEAGSGSIEGQLISIKLNNAPMERAVQMFMEISGANIIASQTNLTGHVTLNLKDVDWRDAMRGMLELHGMTLVEKGGEQGAPLFYIVSERPTDAPEPVFIENFVLRYKRPEALVEGVAALVGPQGKVLHSSGNMIAILATADGLKNARKLIEEVDLRIPQVLIEAKFVELNDQAIKDLGINWQSLEGMTVSLNQASLEFGREEVRQRVRQDANVIAKSDTASTLTINGAKTDTASQSAGNHGVSGRNFEEFDDGKITLAPPFRMTQTKALSAILTADAFAVTLSALQQSGGADVISNPKIVVASGERAQIHVGRKDPEIRAVADNNLQGRLTYERSDWIESGVRLDVRPIVNTADSISVTIMPQLSRIVGFQESGDTRVRIPILSTREITSQFSLPSGRTVAIGGLTETSDREVVKKVPVLGDLPLIGRYLFTHKRTERTQDEIIIFVTLAVAETEQMSALSGIPSDGRLIRARLMPPVEGEPVQLRDRNAVPAPTTESAPIE